MTLRVAVTGDEIAGVIVHIGMLKMDIGGAEKLILPGKPRWLSELDVLFAELDGANQERMIENMRAAGLHVEVEGWFHKRASAALRLGVSSIGISPTAGFAACGCRQKWCFRFEWSPSEE